MDDRQLESGPAAAVAAPAGRDEPPACRYTVCGRSLTYAGRGRPPEYCPDRRWQPGNKTCKQMAAEQRDAELAAGLDVPLQAYRATSERVLPAVESLAALLSGLAEATRAVQSGALVRVQEAEQVAVDVVQRAQTAEAERDRATRAERTALAEAEAAKEATRTAERRARDAEKSAADVRHQAWRDVAAAEHAQGQAESAANERALAVLEEKERRQEAQAQAADLAGQLKTVRTELASAQAETRAADKARAAADARADRAEADNRVLTGRIDQAERDLVAARADVDRLTASLATNDRSRVEAVELLRETAVDRNAQQDRAARAESTAATVTAERDTERAGHGRTREQLAAAAAQATAHQAEADRLRTDVDRARQDLTEARRQLAVALAHAEAAERAAAQIPGDGA